MSDAEAPKYLNDPAFAEAHAGPKVRAPKDGYAHLERDPSPEQIAAMCRAIRAAYPRDPTGHDRHWSVPAIAAAHLGPIGDT